MKKINAWYFEDLEETTSTNDAVLDLLEKVKAPCILSTKKQRAGRGRLGRKWQEADGNLYVSFAFPVSEEDLGQVVILSAVAVAQTVRSFLKNAHIGVKWPNDVMVNNKKIAGILFEKGPRDYWIMGIGINVNTTPDIKNPMYIATSFTQEMVKEERLHVLKTLTKNFDRLMEEYKKEGFEKIQKSWLDMAINRGKKITVKQYHGEISGVFRGIDTQGRLLLQTPNGICKILTGDVFYL